MALRATQKKRGTTREDSPPSEVQRSGRDSFLKKSGSTGHTHEDSASDVARSGRAAGTGSVHPSLGIGRGNADDGEGSVSRLQDDIESVGSSY